MRSRAYGLVRVGGNVGWALGPMVAGFASAAAGSSGRIYPLLFTGTTVLAALVMLCVAAGVRESLPSMGGSTSGRRPFSGLGEALSDRALLILLGS